MSADNNAAGNDAVALHDAVIAARLSPVQQLRKRGHLSNRPNWQKLGAMTNALTSSGLFGDLFHDPSIATAFSGPAFTRHMLDFEAAWTKALARCGVVTRDDAAAALATITDFSKTRFHPSATRDGLPVPALIAALRAGLPDGAANAIHTGSTSQDVIDTAMIMTVMDVLDQFADRTKHVIALIEQNAAHFGNRPMLARTRMQAALPMTAGARLDTWRRPLTAHLARLKDLRVAISQVQIGGPIGLRDNPQDHVDACAPLVAEELGLSLGKVWHTDRSQMCDIGHWLVLLTGTLAKIGQDVALMAQQGIDEISLSGGGTSSAMPHKQNPVRAEALVTLARYVSGQQAVLAQAMIHEQERSGSAWALEWMTLPTMAEATGAALNNAVQIMNAITDIGTTAPPDR